MSTKEFIWWLRGFLMARDGCVLSADDVKMIQFRLLHADLPDAAPANRQKPSLLTPTPAPAPRPAECTVCGLSYGDAVGYVCPRFDCPTSVRVA